MTPNHKKLTGTATQTPTLRWEHAPPPAFTFIEPQASFDEDGARLSKLRIEHYQRANDGCELLVTILMGAQADGAGPQYPDYLSWAPAAPESEESRNAILQELSMTTMVFGIEPDFSLFNQIQDSLDTEELDSTLMPIEYFEVGHGS